MHSLLGLYLPQFLATQYQAKRIIGIHNLEE